MRCFVPLVQDYLLPTAAYIGGPAELAYFAQSQVLYQRTAWAGNPPRSLAPASRFWMSAATSA